MDVLSVEFGVALAVVVLVVGHFVATFRRERLIGRLDLRLRGPVVPVNVLEAVRGAEVRWYSGLPLWRRLVKDGQDVIASVVPRAAFWMNSSIGPYRIKAQTIHGLIAFAVDRRYLRVGTDPHARFNKLLPFFALQPTLNDWQAALLLQSLKERHPQLRSSSWDQVAEDPDAVAKLYSGYMGAGGRWEQWCASMVPGPVARERLGYEPESGTYAYVPGPENGIPPVR